MRWPLALELELELELAPPPATYLDLIVSALPSRCNNVDEKEKDPSIRVSEVSRTALITRHGPLATPIVPFGSVATEAALASNQLTVRRVALLRAARHPI